MTKFSYNHKDLITTISGVNEISLDLIYSKLKEFSDSQDGIVLNDTVEKRDSYTIIDNYKTDRLIILKNPWRIEFSKEGPRDEFQIVQITDGILVQKDGNNPYVELENQFIQNLSKMHTKFSKIAATNQLEIDFYRIQQRKNPIKELSLAYFDIDNFKRFNTDYGETKVDEEILSPFHEWLLDRTHLKVLTYLEGGDEFILLMPGMNLETAKDYCNELLNDISSRKFKVNSNNENFTVSMGLTQYSEGKHLIDLKNNANSAKSSAKEKGKNRVEIC